MSNCWVDSAKNSVLCWIEDSTEKYICGYIIYPK